MRCSLAVLFVFIVAMSLAHCRNVRWYLAASRVSQNVEFIKQHRNALTGVYPCCGGFTIDCSGKLVVGANVKAETDPLKALGVKVIYTLSGPCEALVKNGDILKTVNETVAAVVAMNWDGIMVDYEPSDYRREHAQAYANYLAALAKGLHAKGLILGSDIASWGILKYYDIYAKCGADTLMMMTPTYSGLDIPENKAAVSEALKQGISKSQFSAGIGSMLVPGNVSHTNFHWTSAKLESFVGWVKDQGIEEVDIWRADIDDYSETASYYFDVLASFLS